MNVQLTPPGGTASLIKQVAGVTACAPGDGGWYYDNPVTPTQLVLCDSTCAVQSIGANLEIMLGCPTVQ